MDRERKKKNKGPWGEETLRWLRFAWSGSEGRARHLKIDRYESPNLAREVVPSHLALSNPILSQVTGVSCLADRPCLIFPNGRRLDGQLSSSSQQQVPQSPAKPSRSPSATSHRFPFAALGRPPFRLPQKGKKGSPITSRPACLPQSLLPASPVQVHELPAQGESNAHTPRAATCQSILIN